MEDLAKSGCKIFKNYLFLIKKINLLYSFLDIEN
jgi:hypothetical protein